MAKANALKDRVLWFANRNYCDPGEVLPLFDMWLTMRTALQTDEPTLFGDLPPLPKPTVTPGTDFDGRGTIAGREALRLYQDIEFATAIMRTLRNSAVEIPAMAVTREGIFFAGQYFDALQRISDIVRAATRQVVLIDGFVTDEVLKLFTAKEKRVSVRLLTRRDKAAPALESAAIAFNRQYGGLQIRLADAFHDRFVFVDEQDFYHIGTSVKDAGRRGFMFSKIEEPAVVTALENEFARAWESAERLI